MAKGAYGGIDGVARKLKKVFIGVDGVSRKVKKGYIGDPNGIARLFFSGNGISVLPSYTGSHAIFGNEEKGYIEMYDSGTLSLCEGMYDLFAVGGGGSGGDRPNESYAGAGAGGGGGYTATMLAQPLWEGDYYISVGSGGTITGTAIYTKGNDGGYSAVSSDDGDIMFANGGKTPDGSVSQTTVGGNGGSGGSAAVSGVRNTGATMIIAGSDGSAPSKGGTGQGTTTRWFGETNGTLYAGGGGGGARNIYNQKFSNTENGGAGGGGRGGTYWEYDDDSGVPSSAMAGTPNTGGGGGGGGLEGTRSKAGGSGIVIIRWGYQE